MTCERAGRNADDCACGTDLVAVTKGSLLGAVLWITPECVFTTRLYTTICPSFPLLQFIYNTAQNPLSHIQCVVPSFYYRDTTYILYQIKCVCFNKYTQNIFI